MLKKQTYLDYNATAPLKPQAKEAILAALDSCGNASSIHTSGRAARSKIEKARADVAALLDVDAKQVIFTSGATEANNTIIRGFTGRKLVSAIEHPSVIEADENLELIPVTSDGVVDLAAFEKIIKSGPAPTLVSVMLVNNETGAVQPVAEIAKLAKAAGAIMHTDAVQAYGRIKFTRAELSVDFLSISAHKMGGPQGIGALIMAPGAPTPRLLKGGGQERMQRAGTENVVAIAGFGASALATDYAAYQHLATLRDRSEKFLAESSNRVNIFSQSAPRVSNTVCFALEGASAETLLINMDLEGICLSSGSACSSGTVRTSHVLKAMNVDDSIARGALRLSLGWNSTADDITAFEAAWTKLIKRIA